MANNTGKTTICSCDVAETLLCGCSYSTHHLSLISDQRPQQKDN